MNRRNFLKGAASIAGIALAPKVIMAAEPVRDIVKDKEHERFGYAERYVEYTVKKPVAGDISMDGGVWDGSYWVYNLGSIQKR